MHLGSSARPRSGNPRTAASARASGRRSAPEASSPPEASAGIASRTSRSAARRPAHELRARRRGVRHGRQHRAAGRGRYALHATPRRGERPLELTAHVKSKSVKSIVVAAVEAVDPERRGAEREPAGQDHRHREQTLDFPRRPRSPVSASSTRRRTRRRGRLFVANRLNRNASWFGYPFSLAVNFVRCFSSQSW